MASCIRSEFAGLAGSGFTAVLRLVLGFSAGLGLDGDVLPAEVDEVVLAACFLEEVFSTVLIQWGGATVEVFLSV